MLAAVEIVGFGAAVDRDLDFVEQHLLRFGVRLGVAVADGDFAVAVGVGSLVVAPVAVLGLVAEAECWQ